MVNEIGGFMGDILMYLSRGNLFLYLIVALVFAYFLSFIAEGLYASNGGADPEIRKMSEEERKASVRNMKIMVFVLTLGTAYVVWWLGD